MILLIPLGPDAERPRLPRVTTALIALNVLVFLFTSRSDTAGVAREEASLERIASWTIVSSLRYSSRSSWKGIFRSADRRCTMR